MALSSEPTGSTEGTCVHGKVSMKDSCTLMYAKELNNSKNTGPINYSDKRNWLIMMAGTHSSFNNLYMALECVVMMVFSELLHLIQHHFGCFLP